MVDEIHDRGYQAGRAELHDGIEALVRKVRNAIAPALAAIYHFEWDAPWNVSRNDKAKA